MKKLMIGSETDTWRFMVETAKRAAKEAGYTLTRLPGRGGANVFRLTSKDGKSQTAALRTTRDRWIAFQPLNSGSKWKTLDDVDLVLVSAVNDKENPTEVEVYLFPAAEVRQRFNENHAARIAENRQVPEGFGMWVGLDTDTRGLAASVGSGISDLHDPIAVYPIVEGLQASLADDVEEEEPTKLGAPKTIGEVLAWAREQVAKIAGLPLEAVKLDLKLEPA